MRPNYLNNKIRCSFCNAVLSPAQFSKHWHEDATYSEYLHG